MNVPIDHYVTIYTGHGLQHIDDKTDIRAVDVAMIILHG